MAKVKISAQKKEKSNLNEKKYTNDGFLVVSESHTALYGRKILSHAVPVGLELVSFANMRIFVRRKR